MALIEARKTPTVAPIDCFEDSALIGPRIDRAGVEGINSQSLHILVRQPVVDLRPGLAAVGALEGARRAGVDDGAVVWIDREAEHVTVSRALVNLRPMGPGVGRSEDSASVGADEDV